ncbi:MAG: ImcF-related family protein [Leclercia sp.]
MSKMASLCWLLIVLLMLTLCHVKAPVWFTQPATVWIVQAGIILVGLLVMRFGFAVQLLSWRRPADTKEEETERIFGPLCDRHAPSFWQRNQRLPWLLVTGKAAHVEALMPGLITERWQVSYRGIFLWCGEPGQITDADIVWLRRRRGRRALNAVLWLTHSAEVKSLSETTLRALWQQLKHLGVVLGWRVPVYTVVCREHTYEQYDRPHQGAGVCWAPGTPTDITAQLDKLACGLVAEGMVQVQQNRRWSWLAELAQDLRQAMLSPLAVALSPLTTPQSGVLLSGIFIMPLAQPGQHAGYRNISLSPAWYPVLQQARIRQGKRERLTFRDLIYRGVLVVTGLWCAGMLVSAIVNTRLIHDNNALLAPVATGAERAEQFHYLRELQRQTEILLFRQREGTPLPYRFGLDQTQRQLARLWPAWQQQNQRLMLKPVMAQLTAQLHQYAELPPDSPARRRQAGTTYQYLKAYLMLTQPERAEPAFLKQTLAPLWPSPDARIRPGEWLMLSSEILDFYTRELPQHPGWQQPADPQLVASVRTLLRSQKGLRNSENTLYQSVLRQAQKRHTALSLRSLVGSHGLTDLLFTDEMLPGIFTREAWEQDVRGLIANAAASRQIMADWVLEDNSMATVQVLSEEALRNRLMDRYFTDYAGAWLTFLNSVHWQPATGPGDVIDQLSELGDSQRSPLLALGKTLRWQAGVGQKGLTVGESLLSSTKQWVSDDNTLRKQAITEVVRVESKPADVVAQTFAPLLAMLPLEAGQKSGMAPPGGLTLQDYLLQVTQVRLLLQQTMASDDPQASMLALVQEGLNSKGSELAAARRRGSLLAASLGQDWSGFATAAFNEPLEQAWQSIMEPAGQALNKAWQQRVVNRWQDAFNGRYPFSATAIDTSLPLLASFITPQSGVIDQFISQQLHGLVEKQGDLWVPVTAAQQTIMISPAFLDAINLLSRTGRLAFARGEASLRFDIQMRPQRNIVETNLQLDNAVLKYFNQQAEWQSVSWPDKQAALPQAVLSYIPLNDTGSATLPSVTALSFNGPWAILRLLGKARSEQLAPGLWRMSWTDKSGKTLSLILRTESYAGPLDLLKLRRFTLPGTVFTSATGGNDAP